jgi:uncharacterized protein YkwD
MIHPLFVGVTTSAATVLLTTGVALSAPVAHADHDDNTLVANNQRFNDSVVDNVYTIQRQNGCDHDVNISPQLQLAAVQQAKDMMGNRALDADIGSDGSTAQDRANAAGFQGTVAETVAINPALAMSGIELMHQWYYNPAYLAIMQDCAHTVMGVDSENSLDRTVVVAVYGQPAPGSQQPVISPTDPNPDYDGTSDVEFGLNWLPWILRGVYPPPAYPAQ